MRYRVGLSFNFGFSEIFLDGLVEAGIEANDPVSPGGAFRDRHGR
jgi:hypothetical protein